MDCSSSTRTEFNINLFVPNKDDPSGKITITGAPENVEKAEKKILNEIIRENFDREVDVPASIYEYVSERGAFIQKLRMDLSVNVRFGNTSKKANKLARAPIEIPLEKVCGSTEGENAERLNLPSKKSVHQLLPRKVILP